MGGDPSEFAFSVEEFHERMTARQADWPHAMTTLSTHDTKRGEDVRARITVLAELPDVWTAALDRLLALAPLPDRAFASLLWQAVLGSWPASRERLHAYAEKAMREAGDHTQWTAPDEAYEAAVHAAVDAAFDDAEVRAVLDDLLAQVTGPGWSNALVAKLVALTVPGVPDVYWGSELEEWSLVDPDNRRPVDFDLRRRLLDDPDLPHEHRVKLDLTAHALRLRRDRPELFTTYAARAGRRGGRRPRAGLRPRRRDHGGHPAAGRAGGPRRLGRDDAASCPPGRWVDRLTGREADGRLADLLADHPVALLVREDA